MKKDSSPPLFGHPRQNRNTIYHYFVFSFFKCYDLTIKRGGSKCRGIFFLSPCNNCKFFRDAIYNSNVTILNRAKKDYIPSRPPLPSPALLGTPSSPALLSTPSSPALLVAPSRPTLLGPAPLGPPGPVSVHLGHPLPPTGLYVPPLPTDTSLGTPSSQGDTPRPIPRLQGLQLQKVEFLRIIPILDKLLF